MHIIGIDPGSSRMGYGIINPRGPRLLSYGVCENKEKNLSRKLSALEGQLARVLTKWRPDKAAVEKIYFTKNRKTAIDVAQARGVIMLTLEKNNIPVVELGPREIKQAVTGYGLSDKTAVAKMVKYILKVDSLQGHDDASDALAIAIAAVDNWRY